MSKLVAWFTPRIPFSLDDFLPSCASIGVVLVCGGLDLFALAFFGSIGGQLVTEVEF